MIAWYICKICIFRWSVLGEEPYLEISPYEILDYLKGGHRMEQPAHCSIEM